MAGYPKLIMKTEPISPVIFRRDRSGRRDVFAFFPMEAASCTDPYLCTVYQHIGQHSAGAPDIMTRQSVPAKPREYRDLKAKLRRIGYRLLIMQRVPRNAYSVRSAQMRRIYK